MAKTNSHPVLPSAKCGRRTSESGPITVRRVEIPEDNGGTSLLGIPTVSHRIARTVGKDIFEKTAFHSDSCGFRP